MKQKNKLPQSISTKFGKATQRKSGYYVISSTKEGNFNKSLHRLIYEDYHGVSLLPWAVIHHKDFNKLNNDIRNLQCLSDSEHKSLHKRKNHPTIVKDGEAPNKKQRYGLYYKGKRIVRHIKIQDLIDHARELNFDKIEVLGKMKYLK